MKKQRFWRGTTRTLKSAWADTGLSLGKVLAAALAAITMALLSPQIMSLANSVLVVGVVSVVSALVGAVYTFVVSLTSRGAKKVVAPVLGTGSTDLESAEPDEPEDLETSSGWRKRLRPAIVYTSLFLLISVVTIAASWTVAHGAEGDTQVYRFSTTAELSEEDRQEIIDEAVSLAPQPQPEKVVEREITEPAEAVSTQVAPQSVDSGLAYSVESLRAENDALKRRLSELEAKVASQGDGEELNISELVPSLDDLRSQITGLEDRLNSLEAVEPPVSVDPNRAR